jgi:hypothetical protein
MSGVSGAGGASGGGGVRGVIYQCAACRFLVSARDVVVDAANERAALACDACGARTWLPFAGSAGAHVVDVQAGPSTSSSTSAALSLPVSAASSTAIVPASAVVNVANVANVAPTWSEEQRTRIGARLEKLQASGDAQGELATTFNKLLTTWGSEAEHKNFLKKASLVGELAFAGQRYRAILDEAPGDERAKKAQSDILALAMASMSRDKDFGGAGADNASTQKKLVAAAIVILGVLLCIGILVYLPRILDPAPSGEDPVDLQGDGQNIAVPAPGR